MKKFLCMLLALAMILSLAACAGDNTPAQDQDVDQSPSGDDVETVADWHIGIVTGTVSQSEDDLRGVVFIWRGI